MSAESDRTRFDPKLAQDNPNSEDAPPDDREPSKADIAVELDTSNLIIGITNVFNSGKSYHDIIMGVLEMISDILNPDRLLIFERGAETTNCTFEWCAEGLPPNISNMQNMSNAQFDAMSKLADKSSPVLTSSIDEMEEHDERIAQRFTKRGISRMMAVTLMDDGTVIGYLSANNYRLEKSVDAKRVLDTVAPFISTKIINQRLVEQLELTGSHDGLTGLLNRRGVDDAIASQMRENPEQPYALALVDIDDFKLVNDVHGHEVGDAALRALAAIISEALPPGAIIGRNGGDEFLAMLFGDDRERIGDLFEAFPHASFECELNGNRYPLSMSVGIAKYPDQATNLQDAYAKADSALYTIKLSGKSGFKLYSTEDDTQQRSQLGFTPRNLADKVPCGIIVCQLRGKGEILYCNDETVRMFECENFIDFMDFVGGTIEGMIHPDDRQNTYRDLDRQFKDSELEGKIYLDYRIITKKSAVKYIADCSHLVYGDSEGDVAYVLLVDKGERERYRR